MVKTEQTHKKYTLSYTQIDKYKHVTYKQSASTHKNDIKLCIL